MFQGISLYGFSGYDRYMNDDWLQKSCMFKYGAVELFLVVK